MSRLSTLKQQVEEMQAEIERLEAEEREPEIPVGTLCWFWDDNPEGKIVGIFERKLEYPCGEFMFRSSTSGWKNARIANDIPGVMVFQKHDGGPCPVDGSALVVVSYGGMSLTVSGFISGKAMSRQWEDVTAYAIITKAEWME